MATNSTNSNAINVRNLPTAQLATDTDSFILQTSNGTQTISFKNLNVVKTDIDGNATVTGNLSGGFMYLSGGAYIGGSSLSASNIWTTGSFGTGYGYSGGPNYFDTFTIQNGIVLSAVPTANNFTNNPLYTSLFTQLTAASASIVNRVNSRFFDTTTTVQINGGSSQNSGSIAGIPAAITSIAATDLLITPFNGNQTTSTNLSCVPYINITSQPSVGNGYQVSFNLFAGGTLSTAITYGIRLLKTY